MQMINFIEIRFENKQDGIRKPLQYTDAHVGENVNEMFCD
jgi:hypothetical protein